MRKNEHDRSFVMMQCEISEMCHDQKKFAFLHGDPLTRPYLAAQPFDYIGVYINSACICGATT